MGLFGDKGFGDTLKSLGQSAADKAKQTTEEIKKKNAEGKASKAPIEGALTRYAVVYLGGLTQYPKKRNSEIGFNVMPNSFFLKPTASADWFEDLEIPYDSVQDFQIVKRTVSAAEGLMSSNSQSLATDNNIEITYQNADGKKVVLRLEMLTGFTVDGQAVKCKELLDFLQQNNILDRITPPAPGTQVTESIPDQIQKLNGLKESGILSEEEFQAKKAELLAKM